MTRLPSPLPDTVTVHFARRCDYLAAALLAVLVAVSPEPTSSAGSLCIRT